MSRANAPLTPTGRLRLARRVVEDGWTRVRAAERFNVSVGTVRKWVNRYREYGKAGMVDRSSRPRHSPTQTPRRRERRVIGLRVSRRWGARSDRLPPRHAALDCGQDPVPLRLSATVVHRPGHRRPGPCAHAAPTPLRAPSTRRPGARGYQEARPHPSAGTRSTAAPRGSVTASAGWATGTSTMSSTTTRV